MGITSLNVKSNYFHGMKVIEELKIIKDKYVIQLSSNSDLRNSLGHIQESLLVANLMHEASISCNIPSKNLVISENVIDYIKSLL